MTKCGKNILELNKIGVTTSTGLTNATLEEDGALYVEGTTTATGYVYFGTAGTMPSWAVAGKTYTASIKTDYEHCTFGVYTSTNSNSWTSQYSINPGNSTSFQISNDTVRCMFRLQINSGYATNFRVYLQIEEGSTATAFEPYSSTDYTLPLGSTYYGGSIDLATGLMTGTGAGKKITGTENWLLASASTNEVNEFYVGADSGLSPMTNTMSTSTRSCSHFPLGNANIVANTFYTWGSATRVMIRMSVSDMADVTAFKSWLALQYANATPVTITYMLATPVVIQLTPLQILSLSQPDKYVPRLNTVYTDASAVQVGYAKSPVRSEYELTQAIIATEGGE